MIYHGTPMTPRAALLSVCTGRAMCVSFFRPDDVEAVEAISPAIMFRQRGLQRMARGTETRAGMVHPRGLVAILRLAGTAPILTWTLGSDTGRPRRTFTAQRQPAADLALWGPWRATFPHGRADRAAAAPVREIPACLPWVDRRGQAPRYAGFSRPHGGSGPGLGQPLAGPAHDARDSRGGNVSLRQCGRDHSSAERVAV